MLVYKLSDCRFDSCSSCLKSDVNKWDIHKLNNALSGLSNLESQVDKLDVHKLVPFKVSDVVKNEFVKKTEYDELVKKVKMLFRLLILVILLKKADYDAKISKNEKKILDHNQGEYMTTQEVNKVMADYFAAKLKQVNFRKQIWYCRFSKKGMMKN